MAHSIPLVLWQASHYAYSTSAKSMEKWLGTSIQAGIVERLTIWGNYGKPSPKVAHVHLFCDAEYDKSTKRCVTSCIAALPSLQSNWTQCYLLKRKAFEMSSISFLIWLSEMLCWKWWMMLLMRLRFSCRFICWCSITQFGLQRKNETQ